MFEEAGVARARGRLAWRDMVEQGEGADEGRERRRRRPSLRPRRRGVDHPARAVRLVERRRDRRRRREPDPLHARQGRRGRARWRAFFALRARARRDPDRARSSKPRTTRRASSTAGSAMVLSSRRVDADASGRSRTSTGTSRRCRSSGSPPAILHSDAYCMTEALAATRTRPGRSWSSRSGRRASGSPPRPAAPCRRSRSVANSDAFLDSDAKPANSQRLPRHDPVDPAPAEHLHLAGDRGRDERDPRGGDVRATCRRAESPSRSTTRRGTSSPGPSSAVGGRAGASRASTSATATSPRCAASTCDVGRRRAARARRPIRLRQDDGPARRRRARGGHRRDDPDRRARRDRLPPADRNVVDGVPELRALPAPDRGREHRLRAPRAAGRPRRGRASGSRPRPRSSAATTCSSRKPHELSGGERQRVALARALVREPDVFLLDEPLSNLDAQLRVEMRAELRRLHDRLGATMVYVTHDQVEALTMGDRVAVLARGRAPAGRRRPTRSTGGRRTASWRRSSAARR